MAKTYRVEIMGRDGKWDLYGEFLTKRQADKAHQDAAACGHDRVRVLTPTGRISNESELVRKQ